MRTKRKLNRLWALGRRSKVAYLRFYPNPGFMLPCGLDKRIRWSWSEGWRLTKAPTPKNPKGL
jgi:hypothetical protein